MKKITRRIALAFLSLGFLASTGCQNMPGFKGSVKTSSGQTLESKQVLESVNSTEVVIDESRKLVMLDMHEPDGPVPCVLAFTLPWQASGKVDVTADPASATHAWLIDPNSMGSQGTDWNKTFHDYLIRFTILTDEQRSHQPGVTPVAGTITVQNRNVEPGADYDMNVDLHADGGGPEIQGRFERASMYKHKWAWQVILAPYYLANGHYL
jgi:hypothetical protein